MNWGDDDSFGFDQQPAAVADWGTSVDHGKQQQHLATAVTHDTNVTAALQGAFENELPQEHQLPSIKEEEENDCAMNAAAGATSCASTAAVSSAAAATSSQFQEPQQPKQHSGVDGIGMWKSWTHNYNDPHVAFLDLLDNGFDATLTGSNAEFQGQVSISHMPSSSNVVIQNNSSKPIKALSEILTAYRSEKNTEVKLAAGMEEEYDEEHGDIPAPTIHKDAIGEYGVGLKQACATLSDFSLVLTKNSGALELGVICKILQTTDSITMPHYSFNAENMQESIQQILQGDTLIRGELTYKMGNGNRQKGMERLMQQFRQMLESPEENIFQVILTELLPAKRDAQATNKFLEEIRELLPRNYINVPTQNFQFTIENVPVNFVYWQDRLVEMTKFSVNIDKTQLVEDCSDSVDWKHQGYPLSIYCGFDALRQQNKKPTCNVYIHSRQSGRLIDFMEDARAELGLAATGVDYMQGLTIIINDVDGELPLKPTKDGLTWTKEAAGEKHRKNLMAWTGAVAFLFWNNHANKFKLKADGEYKSRLKAAIATFCPRIEERLSQQLTTPEYSRLEKARFTEFSEVNWKRQQNPHTKRTNLRPITRKITVWHHPATLFQFREDQYPKEAPHDNNSALQNAAVAPMKKNSRRRSSVASNASHGSNTKRMKRSSSVSSHQKAHLQRGASTGSFSRQPRGIAAAAAAATRRKLSNDDDDSSSGSEAEEEVLGITHVTTTPQKTSPRIKKTVLNQVTPQHHGGIGIVMDDAKVRELEEQLKLTQNQFSLAQSELAKARPLESEVARLKQENEQLRQAAASFQASTTTMTKEERDKINHYLQQARKVYEENKRLKQQQQQSNDNGSAKQELKQLQAQLRSIQQQRTNENSNAQRMISQLRHQLTQDSLQLQQQAGNAAALQMENQRLRQQFQQFQQQQPPQDHQAEIERLQQELKQRDMTIEMLRQGKGYYGDADEV